MPHHRPLLLSAALAAALSLAAPGFAQVVPDAEIVAEATVPAARIAARYAELAGSPEAAAALVQQLRTGGDFTVTEQVTTTTTNPDGTTTTTTSGGILALRGDGMGWGQIAKELGFKLGAVMGQGKADASAAPAAKADRQAKVDTRIAKAERPSRPEKAERPSRPERPERPQKPERGGR